MITLAALVVFIYWLFMLDREGRRRVAAKRRMIADLYAEPKE